MRTIETRPIVSTILIVMTTHECHEPLPIVYIISNYVILYCYYYYFTIMSLCKYLSFVYTNWFDLCNCRHSTKYRVEGGNSGGSTRSIRGPAHHPP